MKNCPSVDELSDVFDTVYQAIDKSEFGPFYLRQDQDIRNKQVNQLAFALLPIVLQSVIKSVIFEGIKPTASVEAPQ